jgi:NaMN:DMB phosphoribosyltransferase
MCECISAVPAKIAAHTMEQGKIAGEVESARFDNMAFMLGESVACNLSQPMKIVVKLATGKTKTIKKNLVASFCPFCGEKFAA